MISYCPGLRWPTLVLLTACLPAAASLAASLACVQAIVPQENEPPFSPPEGHPSKSKRFQKSGPL